MNLNTKIFFKINNLVGRNKWLDAFGRAGAEFVIVGMLGWYAASAFVDRRPDWKDVAWPIIFLAGAWLVAWLINIIIGEIVKEPRPHLTYPEAKLLFTPMMSWKSFPSDHAMSAFLIFFMAVIFNLPGAEMLLGLALWVSWGRVYSGVHYPLDVLGGLAVAVLVAGAGYLVLLRL